MTPDELAKTEPLISAQAAPLGDMCIIASYPLGIST